MTPQERQLVADLFERLGSLEGNKRDPEAEALIQDGLRRAPHALYALVQTTLIQDEALRNADARIQELEGGGPGASTQGGFLDNMRDVFMGRSSEGRPSVPSVGGGGGAPWQRRAPDMPPQQQPGAPAGGGSFLGTAAAVSNMARSIPRADKPHPGAAAATPIAISPKMQGLATSAAAGATRRMIARHWPTRRTMMTTIPTNTRTTAISAAIQTSRNLRRQRKRPPRSAAAFLCP